MRKLVLVLLVLPLLLVACGGDSSSEDGFETVITDDLLLEPETAAPAAPEPEPSPESAPAESAPAGGAPEPAQPAGLTGDCAPGKLTLLKKGRLTIATGNPARSPWFEGGSKSDDWKLNDPRTGKGFESAVAYELAKRLGIKKGKVTWVAVAFDKSVAPGKKPFDFNLQQIAITKKRAKAVDFSNGYFDVNQALVSVEGSPIVGAATFDDLADATLGVLVGTTSLDFVQDELGLEPKVYDDQAGAVQALKKGQVDGIVVDLPSAFDIQVENGVIVGQFPSAANPERFGIAFEKGNALVGCVNQALEAMEADGTLAKITERWLPDKANAPVIAQ